MSRPAVLLFSALVATANAAWPVFNWSHVPVFFHSSVMNTLSWSPSDLKIIARFPAVTIEKWQGCNATAGCYIPGGGPRPPGVHCPTQQETTLAVAASLRQLNPSIAVASWLDSLRIYSQRNLNPAIRDLEWQCCVRNAVTPYLESHPELLLKNATGGLAEEQYLLAHVYDHTQAAVRQLWAQACLNLTATGVIDGCGADASQQTGSYPIGLAPAVAAAWTQAHIEAVAAATAAVSAGGGFILGKVAAQLGVSTNGVLQEGCTAGNTTINTLRNVTAQSRAQGVPYLYECHSNGTPDDLASFLIGAGPNQYWGFGTWVQPDGNAAPFWLPEFDYPLGEPTADAAYDATSHTWSRTFASGTAVTFNAATNKGSITWAKAAPTRTWDA